MKKAYDLQVVTGSYQSNGENKNLYAPAGSIWLDDNNQLAGVSIPIYIDFSALPRRQGADQVFLFPRRQNQNQNQNSNQNQNQNQNQNAPGRTQQQDGNNFQSITQIPF